MGACLSCLLRWLDDGEPSTYDYIDPLLEKETEYFDRKNNKYIFRGGG